MQKSGAHELQNTNHQIDIKFTCPGNLHAVNDYVYIITNEAQKYHPTSAAALAQHPVCAQAEASPSTHPSSAQLVTALYYIVWYPKSAFETNVNPQ